jgi:hypothetical protein
LEKGLPTWTDIKKQLSAMDSKELIGLVQELYKLSPTNKDFLSARFATAESRGAILEEAKEKIRRQFFPKRGFGDPKASVVRQILREYQKATNDFPGLIDLKLTYVESGTEYTNEYGDIDDPFYSSLISVAEEAAEMLRSPAGRTFYLVFEDRLLQLRDEADGIGWGYSDSITEIVDELEAAFDEDDAKSEVNS